MYNSDYIDKVYFDYTLVDWDTFDDFFNNTSIYKFLSMLYISIYIFYIKINNYYIHCVKILNIKIE